MNQEFAEDKGADGSTAQNTAEEAAESVQKDTADTTGNPQDEQIARPETAQQHDTELEGMDAAMEAEEGTVTGAALQLEAARKEIAELKDRMLRAAAEQENFKKRMERERLNRIRYEGERIFKEFLPVVDNLERAIEQGKGQGAGAEQNLAALIEGVEMTLKILLANLAKFEVKPIESVGESFNPQHQEALTMEASESVPASYVIAEFEKGYFFKDRLLRPAKVIVSSGAAAK